MYAAILLVLISATSGFGIPKTAIDNPVEFVPAIGFGSSPRVTGGNESFPNAHPHQISLQYKSDLPQGYEHICGGSIVGADKIITAAHCIEEANISDLRVVAGKHDLFYKEGPEQIRAVRSAIAHPQHNGLDYDYAVIRLSSPLTMNEKVKAIPLASCEPKSGECVSTGWGFTFENGSYPSPSKLQQLTLPIVTRSICESAYGEINLPVTPRMICAGAAGKGPCLGDSGGPLVCNGELVGIASWRRPPCGHPKYPGVYANVYAEREWLDSQ